MGGHPLLALVPGLCSRRGRVSACAAGHLCVLGGGGVVGVHGLDVLQRVVGDLVREAVWHGQGQPPGGTYEGGGHVILRHPKTEVVERALRRVVELAQVEMGDDV